MPRVSVEPAPTDNALLDRYVAGDSRAAAAIFARHEQALSEYLKRRLHDGHMVEEALQETFCRMLESARLLLRHPRIVAWLYAVARNVSADMLRARSGGAVSFSGLTEGDGPQGVHLTDPLEPRPEHRARSRELSLLILRALGEMNPQERRVFLLRTQSTLSFREISEKVGAPLNTVLSRMHRALGRIRRIVAERGDYGE